MTQKVKVYTLVTTSDLPKKLLRELEGYGGLSITEGPFLIQGIPAPPPVDEHEECYTIKEEHWGSQILIMEIDRGLKLIRYPEKGVFVRIWNDTVYLAMLNNWPRYISASMHLVDFKTNYQRRAGMTMLSRLAGLLTNLSEKDKFLLEPEHTTEKEAFALMNWDGQDPARNRILKFRNPLRLPVEIVQKPPLYVHTTGAFSVKRFLELVSQGFTMFYVNKKNYDEIFIKIDGSLTSIYKGDQNGIFTRVPTEPLLDAIKKPPLKTSGWAFRVRLDIVLKLIRKINNLPVTMPKEKALQIMDWEDSLKEAYGMGLEA